MMKDVNNFLDKLFEKLEEFKIDVSKYELDHIAYQAESKKDFEKLKEFFSELGELFDENVVGGRRVSLYRLNEPVKYNGRIIPAVELIEPKQGQICPSGLEHVEFVISEDFENFMKRYPEIEWDKSAINQPMFPMIKLRLDKDLQVKFHYDSVLGISNRKKESDS